METLMFNKFKHVLVLGKLLCVATKMSEVCFAIESSILEDGVFGYSESSWSENVNCWKQL